VKIHDGTTAAKLAALRGEICKLEAQEKEARRIANREERTRQAETLAAAGLTVERREFSRFWNLNDHGQLLAVTVYRRGAVEVGCALAQARRAAAVMAGTLAAAENTRTQAAA
jgi:hypothetical protein